MIERDVPVTSDELHAYVDGELPADRRSAVEAWLATHPDDAAHVAEWRKQAEAIRSRFAAIANEPSPARLAFDRLTRTSTTWRIAAGAAVVVALLAGIVGGWMARGASAAATPNSFEVYTSEALDAHKLYVVEVRHPVEVTGDERDHLLRWLSKRLAYDLQAPNLEPIGLKLVGGRLLPGPTGPSAFFMYEGASGERFTLYCAGSSAPLTQMRYRSADRYAAFYWVERNLAYVVSGPGDRERLWKVAQTIYDQIDKGSREQANKS